MIKKSKKGKPAKDKNGKNKIGQTNWIFFDRETLEGLLVKADKDPNKGGIQFYFTEYTEEVAAKYYTDDVEKITGALTLVMRPANLEADEVSTIIMSTDDDYANRGTICPPFCDPEPTDT